jgi:hypothetical protein
MKAAKNRIKKPVIVGRPLQIDQLGIEVIQDFLSLYEEVL